MSFGRRLLACCWAARTGRALGVLWTEGMDALERYAAEEKKAFALLAEPRAFLAERGILVRPLDVNIVAVEGTGWDYGYGGRLQNPFSKRTANLNSANSANARPGCIRAPPPACKLRLCINPISHRSHQTAFFHRQSLGLCPSL